MARVLLLALLIPISLVQGANETLVPIALAQGSNNAECSMQDGDCGSAWTEFGRAANRVRTFGPVKASGGGRTLCCKHQKGDPKKLCEMAPAGQLCPSNKLTMFIDTQTDTGFCCDPSVFGMKRKPEAKGFPPGTCKWLGTAPYCGDNYCESGWTEMARASYAKSGNGVEGFEKVCAVFPVITKKTLCCESDKIHADHSKQCRNMELHELCPDDTFTLFLEKDGGYKGHCCDPKVAGHITKMKKKKGNTTRNNSYAHITKKNRTVARRKNSDPTTTSIPLILTSLAVTLML